MSRKPRRRGPASATAAAIQKYAALQPSLHGATERYVELITTLLDDAGINYLSVTGRTKSVASFAQKAEALGPDADPLQEITDQIGVRVITYVHADVAAVADVLGNEMVILDDRDLGQETAKEGRFGYSSRHVLMTLLESRSEPATYERLNGFNASVQIRTVLQHAWAEFEHDIRYKGKIPEEHAPDLDRRFTLAAGLLELADKEFSKIRNVLRSTVTEERGEADEADPRIDAMELATFLGTQYADVGWSRNDHYAWISGLLLELGIASLDELAGLLTSIDTESIDAKMGYKYPAGAVRRLDDALLAVFGTRYVGLHGNSHRVDMLTARLEKLRADLPESTSQE